MTPHRLDRPVHHALAGGWAHLAQGGARAKRLDPAYGPFAASADLSPDGLAALAGLAGANEDLWLVETAPIAAPAGLRVASTAPCAQMVATALSPDPAPSDTPIVPLGDADAAEMIALAQLTRPGPFRASTHRFGGFVGVREGGRLVAMAGQRIRLDGFAEVSGVCTHPNRRGRGLAALLMRRVAAAMLARGETPFLHAYASNTRAIALYETLGFRTRATMVLTALQSS